MRRFAFYIFLPRPSGRRAFPVYAPAVVLIVGFLLALPLLKCRSAGDHRALDAASPREAAAGPGIQQADRAIPSPIPRLVLPPADAPPGAADRAYRVYRDLIYGYSPPASDEPVAPDGSTLKLKAEVENASAPPEALLADVFLPNPPVAAGQDARGRGKAAGPRPAVIIIHGGSWQRGDRARMERIATGLASAGFVAVNIEYSLAPRYRFPAQLNDCKAAVLWIRSNAAALNVDSKRIGAFGYSAGAHLALLLATTGGELSDPARIQAVVAGAPPANLAAMPGPADRTLRRLLGADFDEAPELYRQASPIAHVSPDDPPAFLYHGRYDWVVPVQQSRDMADRLRAAGVLVEILESDSGHLSSAPFREETPIGLQAAIAFLLRHL